MTPTHLGVFVLEPTAAQNLPLLGATVAAGMYWLGGAQFRRACSQGRIRRGRVLEERRRTAAFVAALVILVLALQQPLDSVADRLFWAHMVQHVLLLVVVAPLLLVAAPWMRLWRGLPLSLRRSLAVWALRRPSAAPLRGIARCLGNPAVAWTLLAVAVLAWHIPAAYDLTLASDAVHYTEHATFLLFALLAWGQVIDSPPFHGSLSPPRRVAFVFGEMFVGWALALALASASSPWYTAYAHLHHRGLSALADQHLGAGVMWVPASLPWALAIFVLLYRWIAPRGDAQPAGPEPQPAVPPSPPPAPVRPLQGPGLSPGPANGSPPSTKPPDLVPLRH